MQQVMDIDHVLTVVIAGLMLIGFVMPNFAALFMRYETRWRWAFAVAVPFVVAAVLLETSLAFAR